jgi:hypothetical protein
MEIPWINQGHSATFGGSTTWNTDKIDLSSYCRLVVRRITPLRKQCNINLTLLNQEIKL